MDANTAAQYKTGPNLRSEYGGKTAIIDSLIARFSMIEDDLVIWREQINVDGLTRVMATADLMQAHPLVERMLRAESILVTLLRELNRQIAMLPKEDEVDEFDEFLKRLAETNRPHMHRNNGGN